MDFESTKKIRRTKFHKVFIAYPFLFKMILQPLLAKVLIESTMRMNANVQQNRYLMGGEKIDQLIDLFHPSISTCVKGQSPFSSFFQLLRVAVLCVLRQLCCRCSGIFLLARFAHWLRAAASSPSAASPLCSFVCPSFLCSVLRYVLCTAATSCASSSAPHLVLFSFTEQGGKKIWGTRIYPELHGCRSLNAYVIQVSVVLEFLRPFPNHFMRAGYPQERAERPRLFSSSFDG